jgi:hypothetical protein
MILLTKENLKKLPKLGAQDKKGMDAIAYVKFFTPDSNWTWYATEYNPKTKTFFGLVDGFEKELGYFTLNDLQSIRGNLGLPVERDIYFSPKKLSEIK